MESQDYTPTPANPGALTLPGAVTGALGFTAANIGKQLLAKKFKGYGHLAKSSLASGIYGGALGALVGSLIPRKKQASRTLKDKQDNMDLLNTLNGIQKEAGFRDSATKLIRDGLGYNVRAAQKRVARAQKFKDAYSTLAKDTTQSNKYRRYASHKAGEFNAELQNAKDILEAEKYRTSNVRTGAAITAGSAGFGAYKTHKAGQSAEKTARIEENEVSMNNDLYNICELAKTAADMSIPLEAQPVPEAGSQGVQGMTNNATLSPTSVGASEYGNSFGQRLLGKAKEMAACARAKFAADEASEPTHEDYVARRNSAGKKWLATVAANNVVGPMIQKQLIQRGHLGPAAGLTLASIPVGIYGTVQGVKGLYNAYKAHETKPTKTASIEETGIYPEEAAYAMDSAEALYNDCLEKMAYAEELYADAADYLNYCDQMEKQANEYVPIAGSALGSALGATAGAAIGGRFNAMRAGAGIGAAIGGAAGGPAASALENFVATARQ